MLEFVAYKLDIFIAVNNMLLAHLTAQFVETVL